MKDEMNFVYFNVKLSSIKIKNILGNGAQPLFQQSLGGGG